MNSTEEQKIVEIFYSQIVESEVWADNEGSEYKAIIALLEEMREMGYDFHYRADIEHRRINDPKVMELLVKHYPRLEFLATKEAFIRKIDPKRFPEMLEIVLEEYLSATPYERIYLTSHEAFISKGKRTNDYLKKTVSLINSPDLYYTMTSTRKMLCKNVPDMVRPICNRMARGILLPNAMEDHYTFGDDEAVSFLHRCLEIDDAEVHTLQTVKSWSKQVELDNYSIDISIYEHIKKYFTTEYIRSNAKRMLKKLERKHKPQE